MDDYGNLVKYLQNVLQDLGDSRGCFEKVLRWLGLLRVLLLRLRG